MGLLARYHAKIEGMWPGTAQKGRNTHCPCFSWPAQLLALIRYGFWGDIRLLFLPGILINDKYLVRILKGPVLHFINKIKLGSKCNFHLHALYHINVNDIYCPVLLGRVIFKLHLLPSMSFKKYIFLMLDFKPY